MPEAVFAIPGDLRSPTGSYAYKRRVMERLPDFGVTVVHLPLPDSFPNPTRKDISETMRLLSVREHPSVLVIDGSAFGAFTQEMVGNLDGRVIALVHHPLFLETGLAHARKLELRASEKLALQRADHIIVTSRTTKRILMGQFELPSQKMTVAEPGTDPAGRATGTGSPLQILAVGALLPRKGYDVLIEALAKIADLDWRMTIAGALDRHKGAVDAVRDAISRHGLEERVNLAGKVVPATLERFYESADLFVSASFFEGYGMVIAEAMARGLPIVTASGGAAGETAGEAVALHFEAGNADQLAAALRRALTDKRLRDKLADAAWDAGRALPTWNETARRVAAVILGMRL